MTTITLRLKKKKMRLNKKNKNEYIIKAKFKESKKIRNENDFSTLGRDLILNYSDVNKLRINFKRDIGGSHAPPGRIDSNGQHIYNVINLDIGANEKTNNSKLYNIEDFKKSMLVDEKDINYLNNQIILQFQEPIKITDKMQSDFHKTGDNFHLTFIHELTHTDGARKFLSKYFKRFETSKFKNDHDDSGLDLDFNDDSPILFTNRVQEELAIKKGTHTFLRTDHSGIKIPYSDKSINPKTWYQFFLLDGIPVIQLNK